MQHTISTLLHLLDIISIQCSSSSQLLSSQAISRNVRITIVNSLLGLPDNVATLAKCFAHFPRDIFEDTTLVSTTIQLAYQQVVGDVLHKGFTLHGYLKSGGSYGQSAYQANEENILRLLQLGSPNCLTENTNSILDLSRLGFPKLIRCLPNIAAVTRPRQCAVSQNAQIVDDVEYCILSASALEIDELIARALKQTSPCIILPIFTSRLRELLCSIDSRMFIFESVGKLYAFYRTGVAIGETIAHNTSSMSPRVISEFIEALKAISLEFSKLFTVIRSSEKARQFPTSSLRGSSSSSVVQPTIKISNTINSIVSTYSDLLDEKQQDSLCPCV